MNLLLRSSVALFTFHLLVSSAAGQERPSTKPNWDFSFWSSVSAGEENTNSFTEAEILKAGAFVGRSIARQDGKSWSGGSVEYGISFTPLFLQLRPERLHGIAFEPICFRWISNRWLGGAAPYIELAGGAVHTNINLPAGDTSKFNFTARGGAGFYLHAVELGAGWSHISNANLGKQNPEFNGIELRVAYHWFR